MTTLLSTLKRAPFYREFRQAYRAHTIYHKLWPYVVNRWWSAPKLARLDQPLDRPVDTERYTIHLMCGHRDLLGAMWALSSWQAVSADSAQISLHEDGTFNARDRALIGRLFPQARIVDHAAASDQAARWLADYPSLRRWRVARRNIFAVKLLDPYFTSAARGVLVIDGDLLWFQTPHELHQHINRYTLPVFWPSSGEPMRLGFRDGGELRHDLAALNTGLVYYEKDSFSLKVVDEFFQKIDPEFGYAALLDQPAYAYTLGQYAPVTSLPVERYPIHGPARAETVAKHYTGPRREQLWFEGVERLKPRLLNPQSIP